MKFFSTILIICFLVTLIDLVKSNTACESNEANKKAKNCVKITGCLWSDGRCTFSGLAPAIVPSAANIPTNTRLPLCGTVNANKKAKNCLKISGCTWTDGRCVPVAPPPTRSPSSKPTLSPSSNPSDSVRIIASVMVAELQVTCPISSEGILELINSEASPIFSQGGVTVELKVSILNTDYCSGRRFLLSDTLDIFIEASIIIPGDYSDNYSIDEVADAISNVNKDGFAVVSVKVLEQPSANPSASPSSNPTPLTNSPTSIPTVNPTPISWLACKTVNANKKARNCLKISGCTWTDGKCGPITPAPTSNPTNKSTSEPSGRTTTAPSSRPTVKSSSTPSNSVQPTIDPSVVPTSSPSSPLTSAPSSIPTRKPSSAPTNSVEPTSHPSLLPTSSPSSKVTSAPSESPSVSPTFWPSSPITSAPSGNPTGNPTFLPSTTSNPTQKMIPVIQDVGNPCGSFFSSGLCEICTGDCDNDDECEGNLRCAQRTGSTDVPGCVFEDSSLFSSGTDFCFEPQIVGQNVINYVGECSSSTYFCGICEGDCDSDSDCAPGLYCYQRSGTEESPGCLGHGGTTDVSGKDICVPITTSPSPVLSPTSNIFRDSLTLRSEQCSASSPCDKCEGACSQDSDCGQGLNCFLRTASEPIVGCVTGGPGDISGTNYCYEMPTGGPVTYIPGALTKIESGVRLSTGLTAKIIATTGSKVIYKDGQTSSATFHGDPDAGATFAVMSGSNAGGWIYVSNSEKTVGGVGAITFDSTGGVINYEMIVTGTVDNCGGGKTYWNTWVTCEENAPSGQVWEVDPFVGLSSQQKTVLGGSGGNYESFAYDARDRLHPTFYVTNDALSGGIVQFTPDEAVVAEAEQTGDFRNVLTTMGSLKYLKLSPVGNSASATSGTFEWISDRSAANNNAASFYPYNEGIDIRNGYVYITCKTIKSLFILDLDNQTYVRSSTVNGAFDGQPDQVSRILADDPDSDMLYFCEEAGVTNGIHARDSDGNFYTIIDGYTLNSETTGLAFSPDKKHMYVSYQSNGIILDITREDGYPFGAHRLDIKYHAP